MSCSDIATAFYVMFSPWTVCWSNLILYHLSPLKVALMPFPQHWHHPLQLLINSNYPLNLFIKILITNVANVMPINLSRIVLMFIQAISMIILGCVWTGLCTELLDWQRLEKFIGISKQISAWKPRYVLIQSHLLQTLLLWSACVFVLHIIYYLHSV